MPTRTRYRERFEGSCAACGRWGHEDISCDFLAMWFHLKRFLRDADKARIDAAEKRWLEKNKPFDDKDKAPTQTPRTVAAAYMQRHGLSEDALLYLLEIEMDWDLFEPTRLE